MKASADSELVIEPLTTSYWSALAELLDQGGPAGRCWCVAPMGIDYRHDENGELAADLVHPARWRVMTKMSNSRSRKFREPAAP